MKKSLNYFLVLAVAITGLSCQKLAGDKLSSGDQLESARIGGVASVTCYTTLPSVISADLTLNPALGYLISGVVRVTNGATLTAPAGTVIFGDVTALSKGYLVIERGSRLEANGTSSSPVVFTSSALPVSRAAGDWGGIIMAGQADNNNTPAAKVITISKGGTNVVGGAISSVLNNNFDSGKLEYVRIEYAGYQAVGDDFPASLVLNAMGDGTTINNLQIVKSKNEGVVALGGVVNAKHLFAYEVERTDYLLTYGYTGYGQYWATSKGGAAAPIGVSSYGLDISNDPLTANNNMPNTNPTLSNMTFFGGSYCSGDAAYKDAIIIQRNASAHIRNSIMAGYAQYALELNGDDVVAKTTTNEVQFSYNSFYNVGGVGAEYRTNNISGSWSAVGGCSSGLSPSMTQWLTGAGTALCREAGNQLSADIVDLGYNHSSICGALCSSFPDFSLGSPTDLDAAEYTGLPAFFTASGPRGAFGSISWITNVWATFCPGEYCL